MSWDRYVEGMYSSQISRLIGQELPDSNSILTGIKIDSLKPETDNESIRFRLIFSGNLFI